MPKNSTINAIYNQLNEIDKQIQQTMDSTEDKTDNNNVDLTSKRSATLPRPSNNSKSGEEKPKLMITHGKPNFVRPTVQTKFKNLENGESNNSKVAIPEQIFKATNSPPPAVAKELNHNRPHFLPKLSVTIKSSQNMCGERSLPASVNSSPIPVRKIPLIKQNSDSSEIGSTKPPTIATLKSVTTKQIEPKNTEVCSNEIQRKLQSLRSIELADDKLTTKPQPKSQHASPIPPRKAQLFKPQQIQQPVNPKITSPIIHHLNHNKSSGGGPNFNVKPIVSFARDLSATPNRYPDKVQLKTVSNDNSNNSRSINGDHGDDVSKENVYFSDLKFLINENGEIVQTIVPHLH